MKMMERGDQERPGWDGDQFEVLTEEEVVGGGGSVAGAVVEDVMEGAERWVSGVSGDDAGDGGEDDDQAEKEDQCDNAGASENDDGAGVRAGKEEGVGWGRGRRGRRGRSHLGGKRQCLLLRPRPLHLALRNVRRRSRGCLPAAAEDRHRPIYPKSSPDHPISPPLIAHSAAVTLSLRWIRA